MALSVTITATSGAAADGIAENAAFAVLHDGSILIDNKVLIFTLSGSAIFTDSLTNTTSRVTSVIGSASVSFTDIVGETVIVTATYQSDPLVSGYTESTFVDIPLALEPPYIEPSFGNIIDYSVIENTIDFIVAPWANMKVGDVVHAYIGNIITWDAIYRVEQNDIGNPIRIVINNAKDLLFQYIDKTLVAYYKVGDIQSPDALYYVVNAYIRNVSIIGSRDSDRSALHLCAFNSLTGNPIKVRWQYYLEDTWQESARFTDRHPLKELHVSLANQSGAITVYPMNTAAVGDSNNSIAFAVTSVGKLVTWGGRLAWAVPPSNVAALSNITAIIASPNIVAVLDTNNTLYSWGNNAVGGNLTAIVDNVLTAICNRSAICAITDGGYLNAWGNIYAGGKLPSGLPAENGYISVSAARGAFCAINRQGFAVAWGENNFGGNMPKDIQNINNIIDVFATDGAFAVLTDIGVVRAWGNGDYGGTLHKPINNAIAIASSSKAFAVLRSDNTVTAWGNGLYGGIVPANIAALRNIISISSTDGAFCVLCDDGKIYTWGSKEYAGVIPPDIVNKDILTVSGISGAFSYITNKGAVSGWANSGTFDTVSDHFYRTAYRLTRNTPINTFLCMDLEGNIISIGDKGSVGNLPPGINNMLRYSEFKF